MNILDTFHANGLLLILVRYYTMITLIHDANLIQLPLLYVVGLMLMHGNTHFSLPHHFFSAHAACVVISYYYYFPYFVNSFLPIQYFSRTQAHADTLYLFLQQDHKCRCQVPSTIDKHRTNKKLLSIFHPMFICP